MRTDKYMMAKAWMKQDQAPQAEALETWNTLEAEFNDERKAMLMASAESDKIKAMMNEKYGPGTVKYGSEIKQPEMKTPQAVFEFSQRNPAAEGGRIPFGVGGMPYKIFGKDIDIPKISGVQGPEQNKKSVEEGFKKLEKWLKDPTPEKWNKIFGKNNTFGRQLRAYLLDEPIDLRKGTGLKETNKKVFDAINVKQLLKPSSIEKINLLTTGGKNVSLKSISAKTFGNQKFTMAEQIETIKNFQNGEQWLKRNSNPDAVDVDGKNIYRKYANAIKSMQSEKSRLGGFPFGDNSEKKLWSNLYRASYRGDRIKIVGDFADGNLPINKDGKVDWKMFDKKGVPAWKRIQFVDLEAPKNTSFTWGENFKKGDLEKQIDNTFGKGFFKKSTAAYDTQIKTGSKRDFTVEGEGKTIKNNVKVRLLTAEALAENPKATKTEIDKYIKDKSPRFNITEVHHPDGVGVNPYKTEPTFRYANRAVGKVELALKSGKINQAEAKIQIDKINKDIGPVRIKLDDGYYGNYKNTQKSIVEAGNKYVTMLQKFCGYGQAQGGRIGLSNGSCSLDESQKGFTQYMEDAKNGKISTTSKAGAELAENAAKLAGKSMSFGKLFFGWTVAPEVVIEGAIGLHKYFDKGENVDQILAKSYLTKPLRMLYDQTDGKTGIPGTEELLIKNSNIGPGGLEQLEIQKLESRLASLNNSLEKALIDDEVGLSEVDIGELQNTIANTAFKLKMKKQSQKEGAGLEAALEEINLAKGEYQDKVGATKKFGKVNYDDATLISKGTGRGGRTGGIEQELIGKTKPNYTTVDKNIFSKDYRPLDEAQFNVIENALKRHPDIGMPDNLTYKLNPLNREVLQQKALPLARADAMNTIGMKGTQDSFFKGTYTPKEKPVYDFSEGGITGLRSKYEYKK